MGFRRLPAILALLVSFLVVTPLAGVALAVAPPASPLAGGRTVSFGLVTLRVPGSWPIINLRRHPRACPRLDVNAVYLGAPASAPVCPAAQLMGKTESVQILPIDVASPDLRAAARRTEVNGTVALTNPDSSVTHSIIDVLPAAGMEVSLSYGRDLPLARAILSSIRVSNRAGNAPSVAAVAPAAIPAIPAQGLYAGRGFDTCAAPAAADMSHWLASPYRAIGIYIGGINRACAQANLTAGWIARIMRAGWHYFPYYVGLQAPCVDAYGDATIKVGSAHAEGASAAADAVRQARDLGIPPGSPLIYDMEGYGRGCSPQVITFLSAWDAGLHARGYQAGVYESFSNVGDLVAARGRIVMPDVINYADWDGSATTASSYMPAVLWLHHQRLHQYLGNQDRTYGGVTMNIDLDQLDVKLGGLPVTASSLPLMRITVAMNRSGGAEWFARAANGTIRHSWQHPLGTLKWTPAVALGDSRTDLVSNPAVSANQNGLLTLFARARNGQVVHAWFHPGSPNDWQWGGAVGTGGAGRFAGDPAATRGPGGEVAVFSDNRAGVVLTTRQRAPDDNTGWTPWSSIGGTCASSPVAYSGRAGPIQVFCITKARSLAVRTQTALGWHAWQTVPGLADLGGVPAVAPTGAGGATVFARTRRGVLAGAWRPDPFTAWTALRRVPSGLKLAGSPAVASWPGGGAAVFAELAGGHVGYAVRRLAGTWSGWVSLRSTAVGVPAAWVNSFGPPAAAVLTARRHVAVSAYTGGGWGSWLDMGGGF
jgi:hypothetical protein